MAPKRCYDVARLCEAADTAAKRYKKLFGFDLVCKYDGVVEGGSPTKEAMVRFSWRVADGAEEKVQLRCDKACARGVPLPAQLQSLLRRNLLDRAAKKAARVAQRSFGTDAVWTCKYVWGGAESDNLKNTSKVHFSWHMVVGEFEKTHVATVRCDHACAQGVPCPTELKEAYGRRRLRMVAELSQTEARE